MEMVILQMSYLINEKYHIQYYKWSNQGSFDHTNENISRNVICIM